MSWEKIVTVGKNAFKDKYIFFKLLPFITFCIYIYIYISCMYHLSLREDKWVVERWGTISIIAIGACTLFVLRYFHTLFCFRMVHRTFLRSFKGFLGPVLFLRVIRYLSLNSARAHVRLFVRAQVCALRLLSFVPLPFFKWDFCDSEPFHHFPLFPPLCNYYLKHFSCIFVV